jgi:hypothetical protein
MLPAQAQVSSSTLVLVPATSTTTGLPDSSVWVCFSNATQCTQSNIGPGQYMDGQPCRRNAWALGQGCQVLL